MVAEDAPPQAILAPGAGRIFFSGALSRVGRRRAHAGSCPIAAGERMVTAGHHDPRERKRIDMPSDAAQDRQVHRVYVRATAAEIWHAIVDPDRTAHYFYGSRASYDLRPGGRYEGRGLAGQGDMLLTDGEVLEVEEPHRLVQTWRALFDEEMAAAPTRLTWEITEVEGSVCLLTVTHELTGNPRLAAQVAGEIAGQGGGWREILDGLKTLLETDKPLWD
jgi:uncharacterized protein YndB with AHSA1/START domain